MVFFFFKSPTEDWVSGQFRGLWEIEGQNGVIEEGIMRKTVRKEERRGGRKKRRGDTGKREKPEWPYACRTLVKLHVLPKHTMCCRMPRSPPYTF